MRCFCFIFARGNSKGVKRKNIRDFAGKPLIAHSIMIAKSCSDIDRIIVSTDNEEIADIARAYGAEVPFMRPASLADDNSSEWLAWQHAVKQVFKDNPFDLFISLPTTSPLRSVGDVTHCIQAFMERQVDMVITVTEAKRSPYFNMVSINPEGDTRLVIEPDKRIENRQNAPVVYDMATTAYVTTPDFILNHKGIFEGKVNAVVIPPDRAVDIDTELDFELAEYLFLRKRDKVWK